jgi:ABC-type multidrug transport system fused ATPase/permease subunit
MASSKFSSRFGQITESAVALAPDYSKKFLLREPNLVDEFDNMQVPILRNVNFSISSGEVVAVVSFLLKISISR